MSDELTKLELTKLTKIKARTKALIASRNVNKARRVNMARKVIELKVDVSKLSSCKTEAIKRIFLESKRHVKKRAKEAQNMCSSF